jgi:hypothetical protein
VGTTTWISGGNATGAWGYAEPGQNDSVGTWSLNPNGQQNCAYNSNFVFQDPTGVSHSLHMVFFNWDASSGVGETCPSAGTANGQDDFYAGALTSASNAQQPIQVLNQEDGTFYHIDSDGLWSLPDYIEDRNGNKTTVQNAINPLGNAYSFTDPLGRIAFSFPGQGSPTTITSYGFPYVLTSAGVSENFSVSPTQIDPPTSSTECFPPVTATRNISEVQSITLPNTQKYQFHYGGNPYGLVDEIDYPTGDQSLTLGR